MAKQKSSTLLIIDKDTSLHQWFNKHLKNSTIHFAKSLTEAKRQLDMHTVDYIFLDEVIAGDNLSGVNKLFTKDDPKIYTVFLTTNKGTQSLLNKTFKHNIQDILVKPFDLFSIQKAITQANHHKTVIDSMSEMLNVFKKRAYHDSLTHLYNRRMLFEQGEKEFAKAKRSGQPLSALMIDIDHFKKVNSNYGHLVGDSFLVQIAGLLQANLRSYDFISRFGGEEFVIILPNTQLKRARIVAEKLRQSVEQYSFFHGKGFFHMTCSIGVCNFSDETPTFESLLGKVDAAVMQAKKKGRNRTFSSGDPIE
ncbi:MAG: diguanylate cyclase [Parachlamydiales bacterium]|nr:diguanylate cyclase [Parachlamydiales bacterium]